MIVYFLTEYALGTGGCHVVSIDLYVNIDGSMNVNVALLHFQGLVKAVWYERGSALCGLKSNVVKFCEMYVYVTSKLLLYWNIVYRYKWNHYV
jgi:hypothetical protein